MNTTQVQEKGLENAYYILNSDNKLELHLDGKNAYQMLSEECKSNIKSAFIWGRQRGAWVSRSKYGGVPYSMRDYTIEFKGADERKTFEASREQRIERAENRAERYEGYAESREKKAESLQSEFNRLRKDWSWLTQPYVNTSGGRTFRNQKEKVMARYEKGIESYQIAQSHKERAAQLRASANESELKSESYLLNRVKEGEKAVKMYDKFIERYADYLERIDTLKPESQIWIKQRINYYETAFEKLAFYMECLKELDNSRIEAGELSVMELNKKVTSGGLKKQVKEYLKTKYNIDLVTFTKAFGSGTSTYYYIKTVQPLPLEYHSGWAADNAAQINIEKLMKDIQSFNI